ncbi:hypothetical protein ADP71_30520 [Vitreoscilla sp. C1]|uniref:YdcF family protein n=1 Tax=Vitreoscilla sp. (strain C1) TaxID=96942 RepID=UPI000CDBFB14|nr:YdcF family protein [Vitreoscilla sp. C1]AUZ06247.1 hypothetical protein ADP71_30520 [Vitreoscilla sp. C1]
MNKHKSFWYYLRRGVYLSVLAVLVLQTWALYQVWHYAQPQTLQQADAAVVLGAAAWGKNPSPVFKERINYGLKLYRDGMVDKLIFTGGTPVEGYPTEAAVAARYAGKQGIKQADMILESQSRDTYENLYNTRELLFGSEMKRLIVISDPHHLARAHFIADDLGMDVQTAPTPTSRYNDSAQSKQLRLWLEESFLLVLYQAGRLFPQARDHIRT